MLNETVIRKYTMSHILTNKLIFSHMNLRFSYIDLRSSYIGCLKYILGNEKLEKL